MIRIAFALLLSLCVSAHAQLNGGGTGFPGPGMPAATSAPMVTPLIFSDEGPGPSTSTANYIGINGSAWTSTVSARDNPISIDGTISNLSVRFPVATGGAATYDVVLTLNGTASALTCQVTNAALTCADNVNSVAVVAGDVIGWRVTPTGTPAAQAIVSISAVFTSSVAGESALFAAPGGSVSSSAANYSSFGAGPIWNAAEATVSGLIPTDGVLDRLYIVSNTAPGAAKSLALTIYKNGSATSLTCLLTGAGSGAGVTTCNDISGGHSITVAAGDSISIEAAPTGTPSVGTVRASLRWVPTIAGEAIAQVVTVAPSSSLTRYSSIMGQISTTSEAATLDSLAPSAFTVKKLFAAVSAAPGGAANRVITLRQGTGGGQSSTALTCTIPSGSASCSDTSNSVPVSAGDLLNTQQVPNSTPAASTWFKSAVVIATP